MKGQIEKRGDGAYRLRWYEGRKEGKRVYSGTQTARKGWTANRASPRGPGRNRTADTVIFSHVLYQLSYLARGPRDLPASSERVKPAASKRRAPRAETRGE